MISREHVNFFMYTFEGGEEAEVSYCDENFGSGVAEWKD